MKKVLITGGAGFIGSALIRELQRANYDISVIDNLSFGNREFINIPDSKFHEVDILDKDRVDEILKREKPQWIVHLAAIHFIPYCNQHPYESANINIKGTANILDLAEECDFIEKVFYASTAAVYPIYDKSIGEGHRVEPLDIYGLSKYAGERLCHEYHLRRNIPTIICRFFNAFGPNETNPHLIPEIQKQILAGARTIKLGNLFPKRDFIHTYDMARAVRGLLERFEKGIDIFNLGSGQEFSVKEIVEAFQRQLGDSITIETDPSRVRKVDRMHLKADITKLKTFLDWKPEIGIDEGIATLLREYINND